MKAIHAYNQHRGGGGSDNSTRTTIDVLRQNGMQVEVFTRSSEDLPRNLQGRLQAATSVIHAPSSVRDFGALLDSFKPDVVHAHEVFPLVSPWILPLCTERGIPVAMTCVDHRMTCPIVTHLYDGEICMQCTGGHEYWAVLKNCRKNIPESVTVAFYNFIVRKLELFANHVSRFIAPSDFMRDWLIEHARIAPDRVTTVSPVVAIPECGTDPGAGSYIAYAGRFTPEKGIQTLLEAGRICGLPLKLARAENSLMTEQIPAEFEVVITRSPDDLSAFFRGARMLIVPSVWFETFGLTGAEAMGHGLPLIVSKLGALPCLVQDGIDGLLFEPGNARDLADKIRFLWDRPELCRQFGRAGRKKATSFWTGRHHFEGLKTMYEDLCASRRNP
jgi:glycosyltransferase involved in cell wall biosynthesis